MLSPVISGYAIHEVQGNGTFGTVYRATWDGTLPCAVKVLQPAAIHSAYVSWCLEKLREEQHPNVIAVHGFDLAHEPAYAATAWVKEPSSGVRSLADVAGKWSLEIAGQSLTTLAAAMAWLHERSIIHTGLTSGNVLLTSNSPNSICITDVGQGLIEAAQTADWFKHAAYLSPERCRRESPQGETSGEAWDVYAFGVLAFQLLTGKIPRGEIFLKNIERLRIKKPASEVDLDALARRLDNEATIGWGPRAGTALELGLRKVVERCLSLSQAQRYPHMTDVLAELTAIGFVPSQETTPPPVVAEAPPARAKKAKADKKAAQKSPEPAKPAPVAEPKPSKKESTAPKSTIPVAAPAAEGKPAKLWIYATCGVGAAAIVAAAIAGNLSSAKSALEEQLSQSAAELTTARDENTKVATIVQKQAAELQQSAKSLQVALANGRREQETTDQLLATLLEQKPQEERLFEIWKDRLLDYQAKAEERLKLFDASPDTKESSARTRWSLAEIASSLGDEKRSATLLDESLRDVEAASNATTTKEQQAEWDLFSGRIQSRKGAISLKQGHQAEAIQLLSQASKALEAYLVLHPEEPVASRELARTVWLEGRALLAKPDPASALDRFKKSAQLAQQLMHTDARREEDFFRYVDSYHEQGRAQAMLKKDEEALKCYLEPLEDLRKYDRDHRDSAEASQRLATTYLEMGRTLARQGNVSEASQALNQGIRVLLDLVTEKEQNEVYTYQLGVAYGEVARLVSAAKSPAEAMDFAKSAVDYLRIATQRNPADSHARLHFGIQSGLYAGLQEGVSKHKESVDTAKTAIPLLEDAVADTSLLTEERSEALIQLAQVHDSLGRTYEILKNKDETLESCTKAVETWQLVLAGDPKNEVAQSALARAMELLRRLKP